MQDMERFLQPPQQLRSPFSTRTDTADEDLGKMARVAFRKPAFQHGRRIPAQQAGPEKPVGLNGRQRQGAVRKRLPGKGQHRLVLCPDVQRAAGRHGGMERELPERAGTEGVRL